MRLGEAECQWLVLVSRLDGELSCCLQCSWQTVAAEDAFSVAATGRQAEAAAGTLQLF